MVFGPNSSAPIPTWGNISLYSSDYVDQLAPFRLPVSPSAPIASEHEVAREIRQRTINLPGTCGGGGGILYPNSLGERYFDYKRVQRRPR